MKAVILAGGLGTRLSEETVNVPKPMVEIGGKPILWHIMKIFSAYGITDFIICCGYKSHIIKQYFANYFLHGSDVTFSLQDNVVKVHRSHVEPWKVTLVDTGEYTMTAGRIKRIEKYIKDEDVFCLTYGDGLSDVDVDLLIDFHRSQKTIATLTAVTQPGRFGSVDIVDKKVKTFIEKPGGDGGRINGGFFVMSPKILDYIEGDQSVLELEPLNRLSEIGQLSAYEHDGFWRPMDTMRDKMLLEELWNKSEAPWKVW